MLKIIIIQTSNLYTTGTCLNRNAILVDTRDQFNQQRFFPIGIDPHFRTDIDGNWYFQRNYYNLTRYDLSCCSDVVVELHYIPPVEMYLLEYFIYHVHPFGLENNLTETYPKKLKLDEILKASNTPSFAESFQKFLRQNKTIDRSI